MSSREDPALCPLLRITDYSWAFWVIPPEERWPRSRQHSLKLYSVRSRRSLTVLALASALMPPVSLFAADAACLGTLRGLVIVDEVVGIISVKE